MEIYSMPGLASKFNKLQITVIGLVVLRGVSTYGMTALEVSNIVGYQTNYTPLYAASVAKTTKNEVTTTNREENQLLFAPALVTVFNKFLINNLAISAADKLAMGIHEMGAPGAPVPQPTQAPIVTISYDAPLQHIVKMRNAATNRIGKPKDANLKINIGKSGETMTYLLSQKGMTVYFFARWVTKKGEYGPWGAYFSAVIA
jgi:hypothetical protein